MIFTAGPLVATASGSVGGNTFSRNRYGQYVRARAIPVNPVTADSTAAHNRMANASAAWQALTAANRSAWATWAQTHPITNALGIPQILAGNAAYNQVNIVIALIGGSVIADPPIGNQPPALTALTLSADIGLGTFDIAFTPTPAGAAEKLIIRAAVVDSAGITYVRNLLRIVGFSAAAQASPLDIEALVAAKFGTLQVGQTVHVDVRVADTAIGLPSIPLTDSAVIVST